MYIEKRTDTGKETELVVEFNGELVRPEHKIHLPLKKGGFMETEIKRMYDSNRLVAHRWEEDESEERYRTTIVVPLIAEELELSKKFNPFLPAYVDYPDTSFQIISPNKMKLECYFKSSVRSCENKLRKLIEAIRSNTYNPIAYYIDKEPLACIKAVDDNTIVIFNPNGGEHIYIFVEFDSCIVNYYAWVEKFDDDSSGMRRMVDTISSIMNNEIYYVEKKTTKDYHKYEHDEDRGLLCKGALRDLDQKLYTRTYAPEIGFAGYEVATITCWNWRKFENKYRKLLGLKNDKGNLIKLNKQRQNHHWQKLKEITKLEILSSTAYGRYNKRYKQKIVFSKGHEKIKLKRTTITCYNHIDEYKSTDKLLLDGNSSEKEMVMLMARLMAPYWHKRYSMVVIDGLSSWKLRITYEDGTKQLLRCHYGEPYYAKAMFKVINKILEEHELNMDAI